MSLGSAPLATVPMASLDSEGAPSDVTEAGSAAEASTSAGGGTVSTVEAAGSTGEASYLVLGVSSEVVESGSVGDTSDTTSNTAPASIAEQAAASDYQAAVQLFTSANVSEAAPVDELYFGQTGSYSDTAEAVSAADTTSATLSLNYFSAEAEAANASEASAQTSALARSRTDAANAQDAPSSALTGSAQASEAGAAVDAPTGFVSSLADRAEAAAASDSSAGTIAATAARLEAGVITEASTGHGGLGASISEQVGVASSTQASRTVLSQTITETSPISDAQAVASVTKAASVHEAANAGDARTVSLEVNRSVVEQANATSAEHGLATLFAERAEAIIISDGQDGVVKLNYFATVAEAQEALEAEDAETGLNASATDKLNARDVSLQTDLSGFKLFNPEVWRVLSRPSVWFVVRR